MKLGRTKMAVAACTVMTAAILAGCGENPDALVAAAKESLAKNDRNAAIIQLKNALQINPEIGEARYLLGKSEFEAGDMAAAEKELRKARDLKVPDEQVVPQLARVLIAKGEFKKAVEQFGNVELGSPEGRAELATVLAQAQLATGNTDAAAAGFAAALKAVPGYGLALLGDARLKAGAGDLAGAKALVETVLAKSPNDVEGWMIKGDIANSEQQFDNALAAYRKVLELRTNYLPAHFKIASILIQHGKAQEAAVQIDALKKVAPTHPQTLYLQALLAFREGNFVAAREAIQLQLRAAPDNFSGLVLDGSIQYQLGSYVQAEASLKKALQQVPNHRAARVMLVNTYLRNRQPARALETLKPLLNEGSPSADILALAGEVYIQNGNGKEAERFLAQASALDPEDSRKRTALALSHVSTGASDRGMKELEEAAAADSGSRADLALIAANVRERKYEAALKAITALEGKQPNKALPHILRGSVYAAKGDMAAARQSFNRAVALEPANFAAAAGLAQLDLNDKKPDDARKRFEAVLAKDPKNTRAILGLAEVTARSGGTTDEVAALIGKAISADPTSVLPRLALINLYVHSKEPKKAVAAAQDALAAMPDRPELLEAAGQAQMAAGDADQALAAFRKFAQVRPDAPEPYIRMAGVQMATKDTDGAVQSLKKALALKPDQVNIQRAMVRVNLDAGRDADAMAMARDVQKQRPKESVGYILEGDIQASKRAWVEAAAAYRNGLKVVPATDLAIRLDAALRAGGSVAEADKFSAGWLHDHSKDRQLRAYLAETAIRKKDFTAAATHYKVMLEIQADDAMTLNNLAYVSSQLKDPKALEYAERANKIAPNNAAIMDTLGMVLVEGGEVKRGVEVMQRASGLAPASPEIRLNLARALIKDGQKAAAKKELETLAQLGDKFSGQAEVGKLMQGL